jgi:Ca2+-binding RTX toxin-like protein
LFLPHQRGGSAHLEANMAIINGTAAGEVLGNTGPDALAPVNTIVEDDIVDGKGGGDTLKGGGGNDVLIGGEGADWLYGGHGAGGPNGTDAGNDWASYETAMAAVIASLETPGDPTGNTGDAAGDKYFGIENLRGSDLDDTLTGDSSNNILQGGKGDDKLYGGAGDDTFIGDNEHSLKGGGGSDEVIDGGTGIDTLTFEGVDTVGPYPGLGLIGGTAFLGEASTPFAAGNLAITNIENLRGGDYNDLLFGNSEVNTVEGGKGNDFIKGGGGGDILSGGEGEDTLIVGNALIPIAGEIVADLADPSRNNGDLLGDTLSGFENLSVDPYGGVLGLITATKANLFGNHQNNTLSGGEGNDLLDGRAGIDTLKGGGGDDKLIGGAGADALTGGDGSDTASYETATSGVVANMATVASNTGDAAGDTYKDIESLIGSNFDDELTAADKPAPALPTDPNPGFSLNGLGGNDRLFGGNADDTFEDMAGYNIIGGGAGIDTLVINATQAEIAISKGRNGEIIFSKDGVFANTATGIEKIKFQDNTIDFSSIVIKDIIGTNKANNLKGTKDGEFIFGKKGNDKIAGNGGFDHLFGGNGADMMRGGAGDDVLAGGKGNDTLFGGAGKDSFEFTHLGSKNQDTIKDFNIADDLIRLDGGKFSELANGALSADAFKIIGKGNAKIDKDDHIIYDTKKGTLAYDADGKGGKDAVVFANIDKGLALTADDFFIF